MIYLSKIRAESPTSTIDPKKSKLHLSSRQSSESVSLLVVLLLIQFTFILSVFLDIPVARQVLGFVCLTFVPGFAITNLLRLDNLSTSVKIGFSLGFSVAFLMLLGLALNEISLILGYLQPLSLTPLMLFFSSFSIVTSVLMYFRSNRPRISFNWFGDLSRRSFLFAIVPILGVVGAIWATLYGNNLFLLGTILLIVLVILVGLLSQKNLPVILLAISAALLLCSALISIYLVSLGSDVSDESLIAHDTQQDAHWILTSPRPLDLLYSRMNSLLSITILPVFYSTLLNIDVIWVFKLLFPLIFAFAPLILYGFWQDTFGKRGAFIAAVFMMAQATFFTEMLGLGRQMIAELFLALLLIVLLSRKLGPTARTVCFIVFSFALIVSHYAIAEIFFAFLFLSWVILVLTRHFDRKITLWHITVFAISLFAWYIFTSNAGVFESTLEFGNYVVSQLSEFFNPASRGQLVLRGLGFESAPSVWNLSSRVFAYLTEILVLFGFFSLVIKRSEVKVNREHYMFITCAVLFLAALVLVPGLANTMNMTRFYHILLFFLAPLIVIGASFVVKSVLGRKKEEFAVMLLLAVLIPYFLFQTGFVYEVAKSESYSVPLSGYRMPPYLLNGHFGYITAEDAFAAQWLPGHLNGGDSSLYADSSSRFNVLTIYGLMWRSYVSELSNATILKSGDIVYLSKLNVVYNTARSGSFYWNLSDPSFLEDASQIYTNSGAEILRYNR